MVGGLVGATLIKAGGIAPIVWSGFGKILLFIIISPRQVFTYKPGNFVRFV